MTVQSEQAVQAVRAAKYATVYVFPSLARQFYLILYLSVRVFADEQLIRF